MSGGSKEHFRRDKMCLDTSLASFCYIFRCGLSEEKTGKKILNLISYKEKRTANITGTRQCEN